MSYRVPITAIDIAKGVIRERYMELLGNELAAELLMDDIFFDVDSEVMQFYTVGGILVYAVGRDRAGEPRLHIFSGAESLN